MVRNLKIYSNPKVCSECGGTCCNIYGGNVRPMDIGFEEWCEYFHICSDRYGVEPLFDPLEVHLIGNEHLIDALLARGINPGYCQYRGQNGCTIAYHLRPLTCRTFKCEKLTEDDCIGEVDMDAELDVYG